MTTGKTISLTRETFVGKVISLLFNMLSMLVMKGGAGSSPGDVIDILHSGSVVNEGVEAESLVGSCQPG